MAVIDIITIGLMCCVVTFGMGVQWRNQYYIKKLRPLMEVNARLVEVLDKAEERLIELKEEKDDWSTAYCEAAEELDMINTLVFWDEELEKEYQENKKKYKKELEEIT